MLKQVHMYSTCAGTRTDLVSYLVDLLSALLEARSGVAQLLHVAARRVQPERQHRLRVVLDAELLLHVLHRRLEELLGRHNEMTGHAMTFGDDMDTSQHHIMNTNSATFRDSKFINWPAARRSRRRSNVAQRSALLFP